MKPELPAIFECAVVGMQCVPGAQDVLLELADVDPEEVAVTLVRNPDNEYDSNAIEVHFDGVKIGHLPREIAKRLAPLLDTGGDVEAMLATIRIHPDHPDNPGVDVMIERI